MEYKGKAYHSKESCLTCGSELWLIKPPIQGWEYYCPNCEMLTAPRSVLFSQVKKLPENAIGVVSGVHFKLQLLRKS